MNPAEIADRDACALSETRAEWSNAGKRCDWSADQWSGVRDRVNRVEGDDCGASLEVVLSGVNAGELGNLHVVLGVSC